MKKLGLLFSVGVTLFCSARGSVIQDYNFIAGGLGYHVIDEETVSITGGNCGTHFVIPTSATGSRYEYEEIKTYAVAAVDRRAFLNESGLKSLTITHPVEIGYEAFNGCLYLETIEGLDKCARVDDLAFASTGIKNLIVPPGNYGKSCFSDCSSLTTVSVSRGMAEIPNGMFQGCNRLVRVVMPDNLVSVGDFAFFNCGFSCMTTLPMALQSIGSHAFACNSAMKEISIPDDVITIGQAAFGFSGIEKIDLSATKITRLENEVFAGCATLTDVRLPAGLKEVGDSAFCQSAITNCDFSGLQIETIEGNAFGGCTNLKNKIVLPETLKKIGALAFATTGNPLTVEFLGAPPEAERAAFSALEEMTKLIPTSHRGFYKSDHASEWQQAIAEWDAAHGTTNEWHGLKFQTDIVVEPTDWKLETGGKQTLTISWHVPTKDSLTVERAMAELKSKNLTYAIWRSGDDPKEYANFKESVCVTQNVADVKWPDEKFGDIKGTHPVRYWVEIQEEKNAKGDPSKRKRPNAEPVFCTTRRRFGLAIGLSEYATPYGHPRLNPQPGPYSVNDVNLFKSMFKSFDGVEDGQFRQIINRDAKVAAIRQGISQFPFDDDGHIRFVPGDIAMLYMMSHGVDDAGNDENFGFEAYDNLYGNGEFANDIKWLGTLPGVRMVAILPFCNSKGFAMKCNHLNFSCVYGAGLHEKSWTHGRQSQYGHYLMECGWRNGCAGRSMVKGLSRCAWKADVAQVVAPGDDSQWVDFLELGRYAQLFASGASSAHPVQANFENEQVLSSVIAGEADLALAAEPSSVPFKAECMSDGTIVIYYQYGSNEDDLVLWYSVDGINWDWVRMSALKDQDGRLGLGVPHKFTRRLIFGCRSEYERDAIGIVQSDCKYYFRLQKIDQNGFGKMAITAYAETGDLSDDHSSFMNWLKQTIRYEGEFPISDDVFTPVEIEVSPTGSKEEYCVSLHFELEGQDYEYAGSSTISDGGELTVACVRPQMKKLLAVNSGATALPTVITVVIGINSAKCSPDVGEVFGCIPIADDVELPEVKDNDNDLPIDDEYGPFVPGEKVELKFPEGAAWKVTELPTGLKWDATLPGVTGMPTKPGTNTVTFTWTDSSVKPAVEHKASATFIVGPLPVLSVQVIGEGTGKVSGAGEYAANKKVTLKATADTKDAAANGKTPATVKSVFAGWYDASGGLVAQTPSLSYVMPPHDVALQARFIPASNDWATADCVTEAGSVWVVSNETKVAITPISVVAAGGSLPTVKVAGLPSGLKFAAKAILKKGSKTEVDIPANTIYGTPTKGGVYNATVTVTTAGKASVVRAIKFIIRTASDYVVDADWDPVQGKVTGVGIYQAGRKVTLKATANKGYVFSGWYEGEGLVGLEGLVTQSASYAFTMPTNDVEMVAAFVTSDEDAASIGATVDGFAFGAGSGGEGSDVTKMATNVMAGVYLAWPVAASALSLPTVKVAGLPSGLKFTAKPITTKVTSGTGASKVTTVVTNVPANTIYGAPSAASKTDKNGVVSPSKVKVTVTTSGKSKAEYVIDLTVDPLPAWAQGEFCGLASTPEGRLGSASMSVTAAGKVSGKVIVNGTNCTFSAASYDITSKTVGETNLVAVVTGKLGKETVTGGITVVASGSTGKFADADMTLFRNVWKDKGAALVPEDVQGLYTVKLGAAERGTGYLSLTVDKNGAVKVAGKAPDGTALSGSATLIQSGDGYFADVFCAPSAYKGGYVAGRLEWSATGVVFGLSALDWVSFNPQATMDYYAGGFVRSLSASGVRYVKDDAPKSLGVADVWLATPEGAELKTFSFTQSTGVWKGTLLWNFGDPALDSVKVPFEGVMVQDEDLDGFGTYDVSASYIPYDKNGNPQQEKTYKVMEFMPVRFGRE